MRVKADALGIYTQDYFNDKVETEVKTEVMSVAINDFELSTLYDQGIIEINERLPPNSCVRGVLSDGSVIPLVATPSGDKVVYRKEVKNGIWDIFLVILNKIGLWKC